MTLHKRPRDSQRARLYRAEARLRPRKLANIDECADFVDEVLADDWWQQRFRFEPPPRMRPGYGARHAFFHWDREGPCITLPKVHRSRMVVVHELTHYALWKQPDIAYHGPTFARVYLESVEQFCGTTTAGKLAAAFAEYKVKLSEVPRSDNESFDYTWDERLAFASANGGPLSMRAGGSLVRGHLIERNDDLLVVAEHSGQLSLIGEAELSSVRRGRTPVSTSGS